MYRISLFPTADMSLGDLRVALISALCAHKTQKPLIVRMEDGDRAHLIEGKDQELLDMLALFGIGYAHLYYQSENFKYHLQFASTFLDRKKAFICFCGEGETSTYSGKCEHLSSDEILDNPSSFVIRMKTEPISDSFVIMAQNKYPTRIFATACDDMLQGVSEVIQSDALLNAPKEALIRTSIGYEQTINYTPIAAPLQAGDVSVKSLLDEGFLPEAIVNYLLSVDAPSAIFTLEEALTWFDIDKYAIAPISFDKNKLCAINAEHIKKLSDMELSKRLGYACENIGKLAKEYATVFPTTALIKQKVDAIFAKKEPRNAADTALQAVILNAPYFEAFEAFTAYLIEKSGLKEEALFSALRFWLTGSPQCDLELSCLYPFIKNYLKEIVR